MGKKIRESRKEELRRAERSHQKGKGTEQEAT